MKNILFLLSILMFVNVTFGQKKDCVDLRIGEFSAKDTIKVEYLIKVGEFSLSDNESKIDSFSIVMTVRGFNYEFKSKSNKLTDEMINIFKSLLTGMEDKFKFLFIEINISGKKTNICKHPDYIYLKK